MKREAKRTETKEGIQTGCPLCILFDLGTKLFGKESEFFKHLTNARIEFLLAIKSLIDRRIESLEKSKEKGKTSKYSRIDVEE
jgi:hypothetical protein